jgi:hypothetical protein
MGEITVVHDISHGLKANQQITTDGLRRRGTLPNWTHLYNWLRIPMKPAIDSDLKPASHSDFIPASIPI